MYARGWEWQGVQRGCQVVPWRATKCQGVEWSWYSRGVPRWCTFQLGAVEAAADAPLLTSGGGKRLDGLAHVIVRLLCQQLPRGWLPVEQAATERGIGEGRTVAQVLPRHAKHVPLECKRARTRIGN